MTDNPAHQQHIQWLQAQLLQQKQDLEAAEALVKQKRESVAYYQRTLDALVSDELGKIQIKNSTEVSSSSCLSVTAFSFPGNTSNQNGSRATSSTPYSGDKNFQDMELEDEELEDEELEDEELEDEELEDEELEDEELEDEDLEDEDLENEEFEEGNKRKPKDILRPEFKDMTLGEAAQKIMDQYRQPLKSEQIAKRIFDPKSNDERQRAKNSLATELRRGAKDGRWRKIERGCFISNLVDMQSKTSPFSFEQLSRFETINNGRSLDS
jgi:hypothetical protein